MTQIENSGYWTCVPKVHNDNDEKFPLLQFYKFGAIWNWVGKKVEIEGVDYCDMKVDYIDHEWNMSTEMTGVIHMDYGGIGRSEKFDIKGVVPRFEKVCRWDELVELTEKDTKLQLVICIDSHHGVDMRRTWRFDDHKQGLTDGVIVTDQQVFHVSKAILSLHSSYFLEEFQKSSIINLSDVNGETVKAMLDMVHPPYALPKGWVEHGFEWQKYYTRGYKDEDEDEDKEEEYVPGSEFKANGRLHADRICDYYRLKDGALSEKPGYAQEYYVDKFLDEKVDKDDEKQENDKFGYTSKYHILKAAKQLKLASVEQTCRKKFWEDMMRYENEDEDDISAPSAERMNDVINGIRFDARFNAFKDRDLPVIADNSISQVFQISDIKYKRFELKFINQYWLFEIRKVYGVDEHLFKKGEGIKPSQWKKDGKDLSDQYIFIKLHSPWSCKPYQVNGSIKLRFKGSKIIEMEKKFDSPCTKEGIYIGKLSKNMMEEADASITVTINIDNIDKRHEQRTYINYHLNHPVISTGKIVIGDQTFNVCKELLSYHSPILRQMFLSSSEIVLADVDPLNFRRILNLIYPTMLLPRYWDRADQKDQLASMAKLLEIAHKYGLDMVKERIERHVNDWELTEVLGWQICMADQFDMPNMMKYLNRWESRDLEAFMATDEYASLSEKMRGLLVRMRDGRREFKATRDAYKRELIENGCEDIKLGMIIFDITHA